MKKRLVRIVIEFLIMELEDLYKKFSDPDQEGPELPNG